MVRSVALWAFAVAVTLWISEVQCQDRGTARSEERPQPISAAVSGLSWLAEGRVGEALPLLEAGMREQPHDPAIATGRLQCLYLMGRWGEALDLAKALAQRFPGDPGIRLLEGDVLLASFRAREAVEVWRPLLDDERAAPRALPKMLAALLLQRRFPDVSALLAQVRDRGIPVSDDALRLVAQQASCADSRAALLSLNQSHPESLQAKEEWQTREALCSRGGSSVVLPGEFPDVIPATPDGLALKVRLAGKRDGRLQLDTGTDVLLLDPKVARSLELDTIGRAEVAGMGGGDLRARGMVALPTLEAGHLRANNLPALLADDERLEERGRSGIVGLSPFLDGVADWDRRGSRLTLWRTGTPAKQVLGKEPTADLPVLWVRGIPLVPVTVDGKGPYPFILDTGADATLLSEEGTRALGMHLNSGKFQAGVGRGASGPFLTGFVEAVRVGFAGREEPFPWLRVADIPRRFPLPVFGVLGMDVLSTYRIVFDGPACRLILLRYSGGLYRSPKLNRLGRVVPSPANIPSYVPPR